MEQLNKKSISSTYLKDDVDWYVYGKGEWKKISTFA
jgi:hypothetical protein